MRFLFLILLFGTASAVDIHTADTATINVQHDGVTQFCALNLGSINDGNWNFTGSCTPPATRQISATLTFVPPGGAIAVGVTECDNVMGRASATDTLVPFPGRPNAAPVINNFGRTNFISCHFRAPTSGAKFGWWKPTEYNYSFDLTSAISTVMGDFSPAGANCRMLSSSGQNMVAWNTDGTRRSFCQLVPGRDYYMSFKPTNPAQVTNGCALTRPSCVVGLTNSFGG